MQLYLLLTFDNTNIYVCIVYYYYFYSNTNELTSVLYNDYYYAYNCYHSLL